jgi:hypothetical protein
MRRTEIVGAWNICTGDDADDVGRGKDRAEIHADDFRVRPCGKAEICVQRACGLNDIVDILRPPGDMFVG